MGLLTDPSTIQKTKKYMRILIKYNRRICFFLYVIGLAWFCALAHNDLNTATYISENALLPGESHVCWWPGLTTPVFSGLVYSEIRQSDSVSMARGFLNDLEAERTKHTSDTPHAFLLAKMKRIGLDTYTHNFTLNYPLGGRKVSRGGTFERDLTFPF